MRKGLSLYHPVVSDHETVQLQSISLSDMPHYFWSKNPTEIDVWSVCCLLNSLVVFCTVYVAYVYWQESDDMVRIKIQGLQYNIAMKFMFLCNPIITANFFSCNSGHGLKKPHKINKMPRIFAWKLKIVSILRIDTMLQTIIL